MKKVFKKKNKILKTKPFVLFTQLDQADLEQVIETHLKTDPTNNKSDNFRFLALLEQKFPGSLCVLKLTDKLLEHRDLIEDDKGRVYFLKGQYYYHNDDYNRAIISFKIAEQLYISAKNTDGVNRALIFQFHLLLDQNSIEAPSMATKLESLLTTNIESSKKVLEAEVQLQSMLYQSLGKYYHTRGNFLKAIEYFHNGLAISPDDYILHLYLGQAYKCNNEFVLAEQHLTRVITTPQASIDAQVNALYQRALVMSKWQKFEESNQDIISALDIAKGANSIVQFDELMKLKKRNLESLKDFTSITDCSPNIVDLDFKSEESTSVRVIKNDIQNLKTVHRLTTEIIMLLDENTSSIKTEKIFTNLQNVSKYFNKLSAATEAKAGFNGLKTYLNISFKKEVAAFRRLEDVLHSEQEKPLFLSVVLSDSQVINVLQQAIFNMINDIVGRVDYSSFFTPEEQNFYGSKVPLRSDFNSIKFFDAVHYYNDIWHIKQINSLLDKTFTDDTFIAQDFSQKGARYAFAYLVSLIGEHTTQLSFSSKGPKLLKAIVDYRDIFAKDVSLILEKNYNKFHFLKEKFLVSRSNIQKLFLDLSEKLKMLSVDNYNTSVDRDNTYLIKSGAVDDSLTTAKKTKDNISKLKKTNQILVDMQSNTYTKDKEYQQKLNDQNNKKERLEKALNDAGYVHQEIEDNNEHWSVTWYEEFKFLEQLIRSDIPWRIEAIRGMINYLSVVTRDSQSNSLIYGMKDKSYSYEYAQRINLSFFGLRNQISHELYDLLQSDGITLEKIELMNSNAALVFPIMLRELCRTNKLLNYFGKEIETSLNSDLVHKVFDSFLIILQYKWKNAYADILGEFNKISDILLDNENKLIFCSSDILSDLKEIILDAYIICSNTEAILDSSYAKSINTLILNSMEIVRNYKDVDESSSRFREDILSLSITLFRLFINDACKDHSLEDTNRAIENINEIIHFSVIEKLHMIEDQIYFLMLNVSLAEYYIIYKNFDEALNCLNAIQTSLDNSSNTKIKQEYEIKLNILRAYKSLEETPTNKCADYYKKELTNIVQQLGERKFNLASNERIELVITQVQKLIVKCNNIINDGNTLFEMIIDDQSGDDLPELETLNPDGTYSIKTFEITASNENCRIGHDYIALTGAEIAKWGTQSSKERPIDRKYEGLLGNEVIKKCSLFSTTYYQALAGSGTFSRDKKTLESKKLLKQNAHDIVQNTIALGEEKVLSLKEYFEELIIQNNVEFMIPYQDLCSCTSLSPREEIMSANMHVNFGMLGTTSEILE